MLLLLLRFVYFTEEDSSLSWLIQQNTATLHKTYGLLYLIFTLTGVYLKLLITLAQLSVSHPLWFNSLSTAIVQAKFWVFPFFLFFRMLRLIVLTYQSLWMGECCESDCIQDRTWMRGRVRRRAPGCRLECQNPRDKDGSGI